MEDPEVLVSPWEVVLPLKLDNNYNICEYACHEGNTAIRGYIESSHFERAAPEAGAGSLTQQIVASAGSWWRVRPHSESAPAPRIFPLTVFL